ncbi:DUF2795 domain-containing protein [Nonomuraea sp. NN258]|uniref:DUF2795 domain-containing protein n=1 Tax=Nonomuraea antri TaxID=2730852 RepID=UPI00156A0833|nr:DUF2795 domain-containing protein [Nonomuraea antri]NRQ30294.1 DUF2795 domain-containing protein [Nonomuraea antri]
MKLQDTGPVVEALNDMDFPADKQSIVEHARAHGAEQAAERALAALPLGDYANLAEVLRSIPVDPNPGRSDSDRVRQHRESSHKPGMSESAQSVGKLPLDEELEGG